MHLKYHCHPHTKPVRYGLNGAAAMTLSQGDVMLAGEKTGAAEPDTAQLESQPPHD